MMRRDQGARGRALSMGVAALLVLAVAGCGSAASSGSSSPSASASIPASLVDAAKRDGKLVLALHAGSSYTKFGELVKKAFPWLDVQVTNVKGSDLAPKVVAEQQRGQYLWDVHVGPAGEFHDTLAPAGALQNLQPLVASLPSTDGGDSAWAGGLQVYDDQQNPTTLITTYTTVGGFWVNKDEDGSSQAASWDDLLKPGMQGEIVAYDPTKVDASSEALASVAQVRGIGFVQKLLTQQKPVFVSTGRQAAQGVVQGKYPVGLGLNPDDVTAFQQQGLGQHVENRDAGVPPTLLAEGASVFKQAPHINATKAFLAWFLSKAGQDAWAKTIVDGSSRRLDVPKYNTNAVPDYHNLGQYKIVAGTSQGDELIDQVVDVAKKRSA